MKTQRKVKYARIITVAMALFLSGCGAKVQTLVYDKPISENQSLILIIPSAYTVTNFDGERVNWTASPDGFSLFGTDAAIRLPSGKHNITYNYYRHTPDLTTYEHYGSGAVVQRTTPSTTTSFDGNVTINMEAGKRYRFKERGIVAETNGQYDQLP
ncbi:hypothetical protein [Desulfobulbus sp.]|uniref:hypothetical protein n=1 Tax=Desulfobulbus sp. TaxID=895 RepID=UPI00286F7DA5|nr:hypothetical protein [Desulfobulbus sp.]